MQRFHVAMLALTVLLTANHAQADELSLLPLPPDPPEQAQPIGPKESSVYDGPPRCLRWTDNCVSCTRTGLSDKPACSNIGPACQSGPIQCMQTAPESGDMTTP